MAAATDFVQSKARYLTNVSVWPQRQKLDPIPWIRNFGAKEQPYALNLLNVFIYYNDSLVDALFHSAVHRLSADVTKPASSLGDAEARWLSYLHSIVVSYIQGEIPNPTDSGLVFARKARQVLGIDQGQILEPVQALAELVDSPARPLLLVDDFVGSGDQTIATWRREHYAASTNGASDTNHAFSFEAASAFGASITYVPMVATATGLDAVRAACPNLRVRPVHILDDQYSLTNPDSVLWPEPLRAGAQEFLYSASKRAGIIGCYEYGWKRFGDLALPLAFSHTVPDATLPLYFWERPGWAPLLRRT